MTELPMTALFGALFALMLIPMTIAIGIRRAQVGVWLLDGGDETLLRRIRAHVNFLEYVPLALILMALSEANGASAIFLYLTGTVLILARVALSHIEFFRQLADQAGQHAGHNRCDTQLCHMVAALLLETQPWPMMKISHGVFAI